MPKKVETAVRQDRAISPAVDFVAAGLVSSVSKIVVYPMETRVLLIAIGSDVVSGPRLWHGVLYKALENFGYNGTLWLLKERLPASFLGAFAASCIAILATHPLSNVHVAMQASLRDAARRPLGALAATRQIVGGHGLGGFFLGWRYSLLMRVGSALTLVVYDRVRRPACRLLGGDASNLLAGLLGRLAEVWSCHPLKQIRSRKQSGQPALPAWSADALLGLWSGVGLQGLSDAVKIGIRFLLIERLRTLLQRLLERARSKGRLLDAPGAAEPGAESREGPPGEALGA